MPTLTERATRLEEFSHQLQHACYNNEEDINPKFSAKILRIEFWEAMRLIKDYQERELELKKFISKNYDQTT